MLLPLISPSSRGKVKFVKAGSDWATAGVGGDADNAVLLIDGAYLPRVLGGTGPDAVPVQVAARSMGILKDLPVPAVDEPWGVVSADAEGEKEEKEEEASASAASASSAPAATAEGKATERSGAVSLTATAAL